MEKFSTVTAVAAPLAMDNVDTDMIIPARFLKTIKRTGLAEGLFYVLRHNADGSRNDDFALHQPRYQGAQILIAGDNFGCGSSREHAPWALLDFGFRCVIATGFADIFFNNCFKNGILPVVLPADQIARLRDHAEGGANATLTVDLENQAITGQDGDPIPFDVDPFRKHCLLEGLDDIGLTMEKAAHIDDYESAQRTQQPWLWR